MTTRAVRALNCPVRICCRMPFSTPTGDVAPGPQVLGIRAEPGADGVVREPYRTADALSTADN